MNNIVIAIDGPAGAGKSTVAKKIAESLGYFYLDSGALFRAITYKVIKMDIKSDDAFRIIKVAMDSKLDFVENKVFLDGKNINNEIRSNLINYSVSYIAKIPEVREIIEQIQRNIASSRNVVVDGRDIGTIVFPNAFAKFYLTASIEERAKRRFKELNSSDKKYTLEEIKG